MDNKIIEKNFQRIRREKGLTWLQLQAAAGVNNYQTILNPIRQNQSTTIRTVEKLAALLGVHFLELLQEPQQDQQTGTQDQENKLLFTCPVCGATLQAHFQAGNQDQEPRPGTDEAQQ